MSITVTWMSEPPTCESCGHPDDDLVPVERLYLDPATGGASPGGGERWCLACRATYPHRAITSP
jgi:hypothetical protein